MKRNSIHKKMQRQNTTSESKEIVRSIFNNVLIDSVTDSTDIAFDFVNSSFESAQIPLAHSGSRVNKSTFEKWTEKVLWLIVNNIKEQTTPSSKICQEQRDTLNV